MKMYKGFDKNLKCRDFQYEIGKTYTEDKAELCEVGFHACEHPLDCLNYYDPGESRYCEVDLDEVTDEHRGDSKRVGKKITVQGEIGIAGLVKAAVNIGIEEAKSKTNGDCAHAATNGDGARAATNGDCAHAATNGDWAHAATNGYGARAATDGNKARAATNGNKAHAATNGNCAHAATNGDWAHAATNGNGARAATNGNCAHAATNGDWAHAATNGNKAHAATNGNKAHAATNGDWAYAATNGNWAHAATNGNWARAEVSGKESIASALGIEGKAKGALGCWIVCAEWESKNTGWHIKCVKAAAVDGEKIKADTWYTLKDGEFVEATDDED